MRKGTLYAPRVQGDLDLGLEPTRIRTIRSGVTAKQWARMDTPGGLLPGGVYQDIHEESAEGVQNYRVGTRRVVDDRTFHYCYAGSAIAIPQRGVANANNSLAATAKAITANEYTVDIPYRHADYSKPGEEKPVEYSVEDVYAGGWLWIMAAAGVTHEFHRILGNDAVGTHHENYVRVYLETPIKTSNATPWVTAYPNIYANCQQDYPNVPTYKQTIVCLTACGLAVTAERYFWGQTWGPTWTTAYGDTPGALVRDRELVFMQGGTIAIKREQDPTSNSNQRAGYILPNTQYEGDMMFMLQLAP